MNTTIDQMLTNVYELEGLLLVMQRHNDDVPQLVIDRFKEKAQQIATAASVLDSLKSQNVDAPTSHVAPPTQQEPPIFVPPTPPAQEPVELVPDSDSNPEPVCDTKPIVKTDESFAKDSQSSHDITSAFSINDRFLFLRELFDGDKQKYDDAISVMQRLANIDKIKEFITDVLALDPSNEVVKEFVRLIEQGLKG